MLLTELPSVLSRAGLNVETMPDYNTRNHGQMVAVKSIILHHTAGPKIGELPSLNVVRSGRPGLDGPLAQLMLGRSGKWYVISSGLCWHAGVTFTNDQSNSRAIGIEAEATGVDPWPTVQYASYVKGVRALADYYKVPYDMILGHKEVAKPSGRKSDPNFDCNVFRQRVRDVAKGIPTASTKRFEPEMISYSIAPGKGTKRIIIPTGKASMIVARSWLSAVVNGPNSGTLKLWAQNDSGGLWDTGPSPITIPFTDGRSGRFCPELPDGTTQINVQYDFPNGGELLIETLGK